MVNPDVEIHVADVVAVNFKLTIGSSAQSITVEAGASQVDTTSSSLGGLVNETKISELPLNGRNYVDLTLMQAGVSQNKNTGSLGGMSGTVFSSNGAPTISNNFLMDGTSLVNQSGWGSSTMAGTTLGVDGIQEYNVITNIPDAQYGMTMGSQMIIVSKGGANAYHGDFFEYLRNSALDARNFFDGSRLPEFRRNNFGGAFSGPVRKNRTFFFGVYEGLKQTLGQTVNDVVPAAACHVPAGAIIWNGQGTPPSGSQSAACTQLGANPGGPGTNSVTINAAAVPFLGLYPAPTNPNNNSFSFPSNNNTDVHFGQIRVDQRFSSSDTLFGRYTTGRSDLSLGTAFPEWGGAQYDRDNFITLSETHVFTSALVNGLRLSFSRTNFGSASFAVQPLQEVPSYVVGQPAGGVTVSGLTSLPGSSLPFPVHIQNIYALSDDVFYSLGSHAVKFGTLMNRYNQGLLVPIRSAGSATYANLAGFLTGIPSVYAAATPGANFYRYFNYYTFGFYTQDDWHATSRLTFNPGVRYEFMTTPVEASDNGYALRNITSDSATTPGPVMRNRTTLNFSPRIGFAWDVFGKGRTAVRGGFGILYDLANLGGALTQDADGTPPLVTTSQVNNQTANAVVTYPLVFPPGSVGRNIQGVIDYNAYQPHVTTFNLSVQQQLPSNAGPSCVYGRVKGCRLLLRVRNFQCRTDHVDSHTFAANPVRAQSYFLDRWQSAKRKSA